MVPRKVIVTGGAGFIGSHLVERLVGEGNQVIVIDDLRSCKGSLMNLRHIRGVIKRRIDVANFVSIKNHFEGVDWVFHLAALADIVPSIQYPLKYFHSNVDGTASVLEAACRAGVKRFIYTASGSCYGIPDILPTPETAPIRLEYPYALTKYLGEQSALHWGKVYKMPVVSLRLGNVYGPRSRTSGTYGAVFGVFLAQKIHGKPFTVVGDGTQVRDFTYVTDVVDAFIRAAESDADQEIFNVGTGRPQSVNRLVELLGGPIEYIPKRPGEPDRTHMDISKIQRVLGWKPRVSFEQGVASVLANIDCWKNAPVWMPATIADNTRAWFEHLKRD